MPDSPTTPSSPASPASPPSPPESPQYDDGPVLNAISELKQIVQDFIGNAQASQPVPGDKPDETPQGIPWTHRGGRW